jgi:Putative prokaryotic signal transducing protein
MSDIVTVARFTEPLEAEMARLRLQSAGIETFLSGENGAILEPGLGPLQLQVNADDEADARAVLSDPGASAEELQQAEADNASTPSSKRQ